MTIFKCKMCGGSLELNSGNYVATCDYCGSVQTLPKKKDDVIANLFNRANNLRIKSEFDKASEIYEKIIYEDDTEAEAHWGLVLCKYGIEYVEDPKTYKRIPTCHRTQYESILTDVDFKAAIELSDGERKSVYQAQAEEISTLQKDILAIVKNEKPFDVFICYKETDENGKRTIDSALANDIYYQITQEGLKVFYAAITLEDKLGREYEPYIFAALNSAKVMLVVGTKPEYFEEVWVKNEWSRYLKLMKSDRSKLLIPCYRDMDAYDLPEEFSHLQAQDMSKIGFVNDVVRGIKKVVSEPVKEEGVKETVVVNAYSDANTAPLLERAFMFLEDGDWQSADEYCEKVLDIEPKNALSYLGKLMVELNVKKREYLKNCPKTFEYNNNFQKAIRFGDEQLVNELKDYIDQIKKRNEEHRLVSIYAKAVNKKKTATSEQDFIGTSALFKSISEYKDSKELAEECLEKAEWARKDAILDDAKERMQSDFTDDQEAAIELLESIADWKDVDGLISICRENIEKIEAEEEVAFLERKRKAEIARKEEERRAKLFKKIVVITCALIVFLVMLNSVIVPNIKYKYAVELEESGEYREAISAFYMLGDYKDASERSFILWDEITLRETISANFDHTVGLKSDGTVVATEYEGYFYCGQCDVEDWTDVVAISAGFDYTVGLKSDGTVVATDFTGDYGYEGQCDVEDWTDVIAVSAGSSHTVGLKSDGTVVATVYTGNQDYYYGQCDVEDWTDIVAISAGSTHTVGLKSDGTVVATVYTGNRDYYHGQCDVEDWTDIVAVSAGSGHTVGLKSDGTVVATKYIDNPKDFNDDYLGQCDIEDWTDIVAISAELTHTVGLKSDGTVVAVGENYDGQCNVSDWTDIVAVSADGHHTVGLKSDGTVVAVGSNDCGQCDVSDWTDIKLPN